MSTEKHGVYALARSTQFDQEFYLRLMNDYGGVGEVGAGRAALCKLAAWRKLLLEHAMLWIAENGIFLRDRRVTKNPKLHPVVSLIQTIMNGLREDLRALGLDPRHIERELSYLDKQDLQRKAEAASRMAEKAPNLTTEPASEDTP